MSGLIKDFWINLSNVSKTIIIVAVVLLVLGIWASYAFMGTDYSGFGDWLAGWVQ
jgi:hypothetical protein